MTASVVTYLLKMSNFLNFFKTSSQTFQEHTSGNTWQEPLEKKVGSPVNICWNKGRAL